MNFPRLGEYATQLTVAGAASYALATYEKTDLKLTAAVIVGTAVAQAAHDFFFSLNNRRRPHDVIDGLESMRQRQESATSFDWGQLKASCLSYCNRFSSYGYAASATAALWQLNILPNLNLSVNGLRAFGTVSYIVLSNRIGLNLAQRAYNYLDSKYS